TGRCGVDPNIPDRPTGACVGGQIAADGTPCNAGGSQLAACVQGVCKGSGSECPSACNPVPSPDTCITYGCTNGTCTQTADPSCQTQCTGQPDGISCNSGGSQPG